MAPTTPSIVASPTSRANNKRPWRFYTDDLKPSHSPGISPVVDAAYVASTMHFEALIVEHVGWAKSSGHVLPLGIGSPKARLDRRAHMPLDDYTSLEVILRQATEAVNTAANGHVGLLSRIEPAISVSRGACPVGGVTGLAASALAAVGCDTPVELNGYDSRPTPFHERAWAGTW